MKSRTSVLMTSPATHCTNVSLRWRRFADAARLAGEVYAQAPCKNSIRGPVHMDDKKPKLWGLDLGALL